MLCGGHWEGLWPSGEEPNHRGGAEKIYIQILPYSFRQISPGSAPHWLTPTETIKQENLWCNSHRPPGAAQSGEGWWVDVEWIWGSKWKLSRYSEKKTTNQTKNSLPIGGRIPSCRPAVSCPCLDESSSASSSVKANTSLGFSPVFKELFNTQLQNPLGFIVSASFGESREWITLYH